MTDIGTSPDPRFPAAVRLIGRTGAKQFQMRWSDEDDPPLSFTAVAQWDTRWEAGAGMNPLTAVLRLCEAVIDGGLCRSCGRTTGFEERGEPVPMDKLVCWYQWDPSTKEFQRGCSD